MNLWRSGSTQNKIISLRRLLYKITISKALCHTTQLSYNSHALTMTMKFCHDSQFHPRLTIIPAHVETCTCHDVISRVLRHAPAATQKGGADLCLY